MTRSDLGVERCRWQCDRLANELKHVSVSAATLQEAHADALAEFELANAEQMIAVSGGLPSRVDAPAEPSLTISSDGLLDMSEVSLLYRRRKAFEPANLDIDGLKLTLELTNNASFRCLWAPSLATLYRWLMHLEQLLNGDFVLIKQIQMLSAHFARQSAL